MLCFEDVAQVGVTNLLSINMKCIYFTGQSFSWLVFCCLLLQFLIVKKTVLFLCFF